MSPRGQTVPSSEPQCNEWIGMSKSNINVENEIRLNRYFRHVTKKRREIHRGVNEIRVYFGSRIYRFHT